MTCVSTVGHNSEPAQCFNISYETSEFVAGSMPGPQTADGTSIYSPHSETQTRQYPQRHQSNQTITALVLNFVVFVWVFFIFVRIL